MDIIVPSMADRDNAAGAVGLVQTYVNTVDIQDGPEELSDPNALERWLVAHGLMHSGQEVSGADLKNAIAVREAIRGVIGATTGATIYPLDIATLNGAAAASRLRARFGADGKARLEPEAGGVARSEEHTSELQSQSNLVCRLLLEKKKSACSFVRPRPLPSAWTLGAV